jgi:hypothetical protein
MRLSENWWERVMTFARVLPVVMMLFGSLAFLEQLLGYYWE